MYELPLFTVKMLHEPLLLLLLLYVMLVLSIMWAGCPEHAIHYTRCLGTGVERSLGLTGFREAYNYIPHQLNLVSFFGRRFL